MIRSMTGFGRSETVCEAYKLTVEMKSVNHRYFDLSIRMPRLFNRFEAQIRTLLKTGIERGKIDLYISYENYAAAESSVKYNRALAEEYLKYCRQMASDLGIQDDIRVSMLARFPDVLTNGEGETDEEQLWEALSAGLKEACAHFVEARTAEGENLKNDILGKLDTMRGALAVIEERAPAIVEEYRENLRTRINEILADRTIDEGRLTTEVTIYADRICVDEEMVRLHSHIDQMEKELKKGGPVGKKLDFIAQKLNALTEREFQASRDLLCMTM